jgi:hypothetical protein
VKGQAIVRLAIWLATAICVAMLFAPLVRDFMVRLSLTAESFGVQ